MDKVSLNSLVRLLPLEQVSVFVLSVVYVFKQPEI
jgi:hypothetical protein